jgi:hypothetical protein
MVYTYLKIFSQHQNSKIMAVRLRPFNRGCDDKVPPGTTAQLLFADAHELTSELYPVQYWRDFVAAGGTLPAGVTLPVTADQDTDDVTIATAMAFPVTKGFTAVDIVIQSGSYEIKSEGEVQFLALKSKVMFEIIGSDAYVRSWTKKIMNRCAICLVTEVNSSSRSVFGNKAVPAFISGVDIQSGKKPGDKRVGAFILDQLNGDVPLVYPNGFAIPLATFP